MAKLYSKNTWTDEVLANAAKYLVKDDDGNTVYENALIQLATEVVTACSPVNAERMQNIEDGIDALDDLLVALQSTFGLDVATEITVAGGVLTLSQTIHKIQPETSTADDIDTLAGLSAGQFGVLTASDAGTDTLTFKHGTGNISCSGGSDIDLSEGAIIVYYDGTTYYISGGGGGGGSAPATKAENDFQGGDGAGAWIKKTLAETKTILAVTDLQTILSSGWIPADGTWTFSSADAPTYVVSVNADMTGIISVGMKIKLTHATVKYFIVTAVGAFSG
jgi:hypothetical protein